MRDLRWKFAPKQSSGWTWLHDLLWPIGTAASGFDELGWFGWGGHAWIGPSDVQQGEEPYYCQQTEVVVKKG